MTLHLGIPEEARSLPPPPLVNFPSVWMAGIFWLSALLDNGLNRRPVLRAGIHRQILMTTMGFCLGYYIKRYSNFYYAGRDRELFSYIKQHPEDFVEEGAFQEASGLSLKTSRTRNKTSSKPNQEVQLPLEKAPLGQP